MKLSDKRKKEIKTELWIGESETRLKNALIKEGINSEDQLFRRIDKEARFNRSSLKIAGIGKGGFEKLASSCKRKFIIYDDGITTDEGLVFIQAAISSRKAEKESTDKWVNAHDFYPYEDGDYMVFATIEGEEKITFDSYSCEIGWAMEYEYRHRGGAVVWAWKRMPTMPICSLYRRFYKNDEK